MALVSCVVSVIIAGDETIDKGVCQWVSRNLRMIT
jgi:hypothetical protein